MKWKDGIPGFEDYTAYEVAHSIEEWYKKKNAPIKIHKSGDIPFYGDGYKFKINLKKTNTSTTKIEKLTQDIRMILNLPALKLVKENNGIYLITATPSSVSLNNHLFQIMATPEYSSAFEDMDLAHMVGVNQDGKAMICNLHKYPNVMVVGTTGSGKSTALKCLIASLLKYAPTKINFLLADIGFELTTFKALPHLSYPIIYTPKVFAEVFLLLYDEMNRRTELRREDENYLEKVPYIVYIVDEFPLFINGIKDTKKREHVIATINRILRFGRNVNIHLVLTIHDPKDDIAAIEKADLPVKMVFQVASMRKSMTALDVAGAEKLKGKGDMIFHYEGKSHHLQGTFFDDKEFDKLVEAIFAENEFDTEFPRGKYGFTITEEDVARKKTELIEVSDTSKEKIEVSNDLLAQVVIWALSQERMSINLLHNNGIIPKNNNVAKKYFDELYKRGILGGNEDRYKRLEVLPQSPEDLTDDLRNLLSQYGYSDDNIINAINARK